MRKMTRKELKGYAGCIASDITNYSFEQTVEFIKIHDIEKIAYMMGTCGINGGLIRDRNTGDFYTVTARNSTLMMIF